MHAFTKTSNQLCLKVLNATLRSLHHTSLYIRLILKTIAQGACTNTIGTEMYSHIQTPPKVCIQLLKFIHGQTCNGKLAYTYKLARSDVFPLCGLPDSCSQIASECKTHTNQFINIHNAACQLTHAFIRSAFKGGGTIYSPHDLGLISKDADTKIQATDEGIFDLNTPSPYAQYDQPSLPPHTTEWLAPLGPPPTLRKKCRVDVSIDTKPLFMQEDAT